MSICLKQERLTEFSRGQASKLFRSVVSSNDPLVVMKGNKAFVVILSAEKYRELTGETIAVELSIIKSKVRENQ